MINKYQVSSIKYQVNRAFTLIEMLVVISLIGILAGLALISFSSSQKQARDTNRKSDLKQYQTALETFANISSGLYASRGNLAGAYAFLCPDLNTLLNPDITCIEDPKYSSDSTYTYYYNSDGTGSGTVTATTYVLWAKLENKANTYWVVCSTGQNGETTTVPSDTNGVCPI